MRHIGRIIRGEQPIELNMKQLLATAPLPPDRNDQRRLLGFDS
jgi:hypothetical protein